MTPSVLNPDRQLRDRRRLRFELNFCKVEQGRGLLERPMTETERVLNDPDLMESIRRSREARRKDEEGTSLEDARREILGEDA